jgi:hypothetical protein
MADSYGMIAVSNKKSLVKGITEMKVYENEQDRNDQPQRLEGGNCSKAAGAPSGGHSSKRAVRIAQGNSGGVDGGVSTGSEKEFGQQRECGGNKPAEMTREKHASDREQMGAEYVSHNNGRGGAKHSLIPSDKQVDDRGKDTSGNCSKGGTEPQGQKKAQRVSGGIDRWH